MNKHFYFYATLAAILFIYIMDLLDAGIEPLLLAGFAFVFSFLGAFLNEICDSKTSGKAFERTVRTRLEEISFELQLMRDCRLNLMGEQSNQQQCPMATLTQAIELLNEMYVAGKAMTQEHQEPAEKAENNKIVVERNVNEI